MSAPMPHLTDDTIRSGLTPPAAVRAPRDLGDTIAAAVAVTPQRRSWRLLGAPSPAVRRWLRVAVALGLLAVLAAVLVLMGAQPRSAAVVSTYRGGTERNGVMPGPAPVGEPLEEQHAGVKGPIGSWSPVIVDGAVIVGDESGYVTALDLPTLSVRWQTSLGAPINVGLSLAGDLVVAGDDAGTVHALDVATGNERWRYQALGPVHSSQAVVDGVIYGASLGGDLFALDASTGAERWQVMAQGAISRSVAYADGLLYAGSGGATDADMGTLVAYDPADGTTRWSAQLAPGNTSTPTVTGGRAYVTDGLDVVTTRPHALHVLDAATGEPAWPGTFSIASGGMLLIDVVTDRAVVLGTEDGELVALDPATGILLWQMSVGGALSPNGAVVGDELIASVGGQRLMAVDLATGDVLWTFGTKGDPSAASVLDGRIVVGTTLGQVITIGGSDVAPSGTTLESPASD